MRRKRQLGLGGARPAALAVLTLLALQAGLACSGPQTRTVDPGRVLKEAAQAMARLRSVALEVKFGPGIVVEGLELSSASSRVRLPADSETVFKVKRGDFLLDLQVVSTGGHTYVKLPFSQFTELSAQQASRLFDPARLLDPGAGLPWLLPRGQQARYEGSEQIGGVASDRISATYPAVDVRRTLGNAVPPSDVRATLWVGQGDKLVRRALLSGDFAGSGRSTEVRVDLHDFDRPVVISPPPLSPASPPTAAGPFRAGS